MTEVQRRFLQVLIDNDSFYPPTNDEEAGAIPAALARIDELTAERDAALRVFAQVRPFGSQGEWTCDLPGGGSWTCDTEAEVMDYLLRYARQADRPASSAPLTVGPARDA